MSRAERVASRRGMILRDYADGKREEFIEFVLAQYVRYGVGELDDEKLPGLLEIKYGSSHDALAALRLQPEQLRGVFIGFQAGLYAG